MASSMSKLISLLSEKERAMKEMAGTLAEEQQSIINMDPLSVEDASRRKQDVTARLVCLSVECRVLMEKVGVERGLEPGNTLNLSLLLEAASPGEQDRLRPLQNRLLLLAGAVERQIELNRRILGNAVGMVRRSLSLIGRLLGDCDTYGAHGRVSTGRTGACIVSREA